MPLVKVNQWTAMDGQNQPKGEPVDVEVHYETFGDESAPPLLLVNGMAMPLVFFGAEFCEALAASGPYWVITYDARDCGLSKKLDEAGEGPVVKAIAQKTAGIKIDRSYGIPYMLSELAGDAVGLLDVLGVEAAHLVGFSSLGGGTCQRVLIEHPDRVASLSLIGAGTAEPGMAAADSTITNAVLQTSGDPVADGVKFGKLVAGPKFFDEAKATETVKASIDRAAPSPVYMKRQMCALLADFSRVMELQKASSAMPRAGSCARGALKCLLTGAEKMPAPSATEKSFTAFVCEVRREGSDEVINVIKSRYSAFLDVKDRLEKSSIWADIVSPVEFPPKQVFGRFESSIVKDRVAGITAWLNTVLAAPGLKDCYEVCGFLGVPCSEASPCVVIAGGADKLMLMDHAYSCCRGLVGAELVVIEDMGHESLGVPAALYEQVFGAIKGAADRAGRPAAKKA